MADGLTFEQLQSMGAKAPEGGLTFEQLQQAGARPKPAVDWNTGEGLPAQAAAPPSRAAPDFFSPAGGGTAPQRLSKAVSTVPGGLNSTVDRYTFGVYGNALRLADKVNRATGTGGENPISRQALQGIDEYRGEHPTLSQFTDAPAYLLKGPAQAVYSGVERKLPEVTNRIAQWAKTVLAGGGTAGLQGGTEALTRNPTAPVEAGKAAAESAGMGMAFGAPLAAASSGVGMLSDAVLNSKGGRARQFIEDRGGKVGVTTPGKGGPFESMDVEGNTSADIGEQARTSGERVEEGLRNYKEDVASKPYRREVQRVPEDKAARQVDVTSLYDQMTKARGAVGLRDDIAPKLDRQIGILEQRRQGGLSAEDAGLLKQLHEVQAASQGKAQPRVEKMIADLEAKSGGERYFMSESEANELRQKLAEMGGIGQKNDAKLSPLKGAFGEAKNIVDRKLLTATPKSGPLRPDETREHVIDVEEAPYAKANRTFTAGMKDVDESNRLLDLKKSKKPGASDANINKLRIKGQRRGENTVTAGAERERLDEFTAKHPELGLELERPELLRKQAELSFSAGLPQHGNLYERIGHASIPLGLLYAATQGHGIKSAIAMGALLAARNRVPIAGRMLYPAALEGAAAEPTLQRLNPLFQAALAASRGKE